MGDKPSAALLGPLFFSAPDYAVSLSGGLHLHLDLLVVGTPGADTDELAERIIDRWIAAGRRRRHQPSRGAQRFETVGDKNHLENVARYLCRQPPAVQAGEEANSVARLVIEGHHDGGNSAPARALLRRVEGAVKGMRLFRPSRALSAAMQPRTVARGAAPAVPSEEVVDQGTIEGDGQTELELGVAEEPAPTRAFVQRAPGAPTTLRWVLDGHPVAWLPTSVIVELQRSPRWPAYRKLTRRGAIAARDLSRRLAELLLPWPDARLWHRRRGCWLSPSEWRGDFLS